VFTITANPMVAGMRGVSERFIGCGTGLSPHGAGTCRGSCPRNVFLQPRSTVFRLGCSRRGNYIRNFWLTFNVMLFEIADGRGERARDGFDVGTTCADHALLFRGNGSNHLAKIWAAAGSIPDDRRSQRT